MKKKLLIFALFALLLAAALAVSASAVTPAVNYSMGDTNMDGEINTKDVVLIKQSIVGMTTLTDEQKYYADVYDDGNGKINTMDVVLILQYIVGMDVELDSRATVTFLNKDGTVYDTRSVKSGEALTDIPTAPQAQATKGYIAYWNMTGIDLSSVRGKVTVPYAERPETYTVTYHLDGGENGANNPASFTVEDASKPLAEAKKTGYTFLGWYSDVGLKTRVTEIAKGTTGNLDLYAKFEINSYTIAFEVNGGTSVAPITQTYGTAVTAPADPQKAGYTFGGWYADEALTKVFFFDKMPAENVTVYARWIAVDVVVVEFCDYDGNVITLLDPEGQIQKVYSYTIVKGGSITEDDIPDAPHRDGYRFIGWNGAYENVYKNVTVVAQYVKQHKVTFIGYDGMTVDVQYVDDSTYIEAPTVPERGGYKALGWSDASENFIDFENLKVKKDMIFTAEYVRVYTVKFVDANGALLKTELVEEGKSATPPMMPNVPEGYRQAWDKAYDRITSNLTVTAVYTIKTYTVTFVMPDGTAIDEAQTIPHGSFAIAPEAPAFYLEGSLDGLSYVNGFSGWDKMFFNVTEDITVTAKYEAEFNTPLMVIEFSKTNRKEVLLGFYPGKTKENLQGVSFALKYIAPSSGTLSINTTTKNDDSGFSKGSDYTVNNNEKTFTFAWTKPSDVNLTATFEHALTLGFGTNNALVNQESLTVEDSVFIVDNGGSLERVAPIVVYR